mmetsp:Transcript_4147/g.15485  ORF Transcript_4147/g.15485 Transcript_4147/m.15485 type:complete len:212 (+) Transcript_4147:758-1393(+)
MPRAALSYGRATATKCRALLAPLHPCFRSSGTPTAPDFSPHRVSTSACSRAAARPSCRASPCRVVRRTQSRSCLGAAMDWAAMPAWGAKELAVALGQITAPYSYGATSPTQVCSACREKAGPRRMTFSQISWRGRSLPLPFGCRATVASPGQAHLAVPRCRRRRKSHLDLRFHAVASHHRLRRPEDVLELSRRPSQCWKDSVVSPWCWVQR